MLQYIKYPLKYKVPDQSCRIYYIKVNFAETTDTVLKVSYIKYIEKTEQTKFTRLRVCVCDRLLNGMRKYVY